MGMNYAYFNRDLKEYFIPGDPFSPHPAIRGLNGKCPTDSLSSTILFDLIRGPWNGDRISVETDAADRPWDEEIGWEDVCVKRRKLVNDAILDAMGEHSCAAVDGT